MARTFGVVALVATALCISSLLGSAYSHDDQLHVVGKVYCDTCRVNFETTASYPLAGSLVRLECHNRTNGVFKYAAEARTDTHGAYQLTVEGNHEDEICEVSAVESVKADCSSQVPNAITKARISLTRNNGVTQSIRYASALSFATEKSLENCPKILLDMGILPPGTEDFFY